MKVCSPLYLFVGSFLSYTVRLIWLWAWTNTLCSLLFVLTRLRTWLFATSRKVAWARAWRPTQWPRSQTSSSSTSRPGASVRTHLGRPHPCRSRLALPPPRVRRQQGEVPLSTRPRLTRVEARKAGCRWLLGRPGRKTLSYLPRYWHPRDMITFCSDDGRRHISAPPTPYFCCISAHSLGSCFSPQTAEAAPIWGAGGGVEIDFQLFFQSTMSNHFTSLYRKAINMVEPPPVWGAPRLSLRSLR